MNLKDYLTQENPIRHPQVILDESEIVRGQTIKYAGGESFTSVYINVDYPNANLVNGIEYIVLNSGKILWTKDSDGNPKSRSVFKIK
jgi:hypothetical protein